MPIVFRKTIRCCVNIALLLETRNSTLMDWIGLVHTFIFTVTHHIKVKKKTTLLHCVDSKNAIYLQQSIF